MSKKISIIGKKALPIWLIVILLVTAGAGAAAGTVLAGKVTGEMPVAVSQALLVGEPVTTTGAYATGLMALSNYLGGIATWSTAQANTGIYSVELDAPGAPGTGDQARAVIYTCGVQLKDLQPLTYWVYSHLGYPAYAQIYVDVNGNGKWDGIATDDVLTLEPYQWQWVYHLAVDLGIPGIWGGVAFADAIEIVNANWNPNLGPWKPTGGFRGAPVWAQDTWQQISLEDTTVLYSEASYNTYFPGPPFGTDDILYPWSAWEAGTVPNGLADFDGQGDFFNPNPHGIPPTANILRIRFAADNWVKTSLCYLDDPAVDSLNAISMIDISTVPQGTRRCYVAPNRFSGSHADDQTGFQFASEIAVGDMYLIVLPVKNASENDLVAELCLDVPAGLEVEVITADQLLGATGNTASAIRIGDTCWKIIVKAAADKVIPSDFPNDSIFIVVSADDTLAPGYYYINGILKQISH
jgi:hypothetical protein